MKEQCEYLNSKNLLSTYIGKDSSEDNVILNGDYKFLLTSPESLLSVGKWRDMLINASSVSDKGTTGVTGSDSESNPKSPNFQLFVVDEAHTVLHW